MTEKQLIEAIEEAEAEFDFDGADRMGELLADLQAKDAE